jgi:hypothetical protein
MKNIAFTLENRSKNEDLVYRLYGEVEKDEGKRYQMASGFIQAGGSKNIVASGPDNYFVQGFLVGKNFTSEIPVKTGDKLPMFPERSLKE